MTYLWRPGHEHFGNQHQILTYVFPGDYCYPEGFSSGEFYDADDMFVTDQSLSTFNADEKMTNFVNMIHDQYKARKGQNLLIPMGCDFAYQNAKQEFETLENMIEYINTHNTANIELKISTPGTWVKAIKEESIVWPVRFDDSFPYSDTTSDFWTGYFSSREDLKKQIRDTSALMNAENKLYAE